MIYGFYLGFQNRLEDLNEDALTLIGIIGLSVSIGLLTIPIMMWIHRVSTNAHALGQGKKSFDQTPGWSVGFWFVPIAAIWKPFISMKQIYNISREEPIEQGSSLIGWWWACWLIYSFLGSLFPLLGLPAGIAFVVIYFILINRITRWQKRLADSGHI
ncbi:MAG: DUF4328 domain-containing protein [Verrucomicrobiota bacterium]